MAEPGVDEAQAAAFERLLAPLAQLMVAQGVTHAQVDELLRLAVVKAAHAAHPSLPEHRRASRVSAATGLHRREVQRLLDVAASARAAAPPRSPALEVFTHWLAHAQYLKAKGRGKGQPIALPRTGLAPSFQSLAQEVTRDVHPRALLEELLRLKLVHLDVDKDLVIPATHLSHAPRGDAAAMLRYLGMNVGDHLQASVNNVLGRDPGHLEQALSADGLSQASLEVIRKALREEWQTVAQSLVAKVEQCLESDAAAAGDLPRYRIRIGMYGFDTGPATASPDGDDDKEST
jgi:Family of unknown function (DUF6502)